MKLSLEIPTAYLAEWSPLCDHDFALAHRVLQDPVYAAFYRGRPQHRELVLDNSMHELQTPLSLEQIGQAAIRVRADYVIAPDQLGEPAWNLEQYHETCREFKYSPFKVAVVMSGRTSLERRDYLEAVSQAPMLCLPYREDRFSWFKEQGLFYWDKRLHLLGVSDLSELKLWPRRNELLSVDTRKPIKWGVRRTRLSDLEHLRGGHGTTIDALGDVTNLTCMQVESVLWNIAYLRTFTS